MLAMLSSNGCCLDELFLALISTLDGTVLTCCWRVPYLAVNVLTLCAALAVITRHASAAYHFSISPSRCTCPLSVWCHSRVVQK
jgi:hypothetical protein